MSVATNEFHAAALAVQRATDREIDEILRAPLERQRELFFTYALEREQVVDIAYSEDAIADLIRSLDVDEVTRRIVERALLWLQRDEALHAQYIRGCLLRSRRPLSWAPIIATQVVGMVGGWCSAVSPGHDTEAFGLRQLTAQAALRAGALAGQIPNELVAAFRLSGFRAFCEISLVLESAAIDAYDAMLPILDDDEQETFLRIRADEKRHTEVFSLFLSTFDGNELRANKTAACLIDGLREISPWFLPTEFRDDSGPPNGMQERATSAVHAVDAGTLDAALYRVLASLPDVAGKSVAIRANFMLAYDRRDQSNYVSPELIEALATRLRELGASAVSVLDSANIYDRYFDGRSVAEVANYIGLQTDSFQLVDCTADLVPLTFERGFAASVACREWVEADVRVILAKLAGDPAEVIHGPLATVAGLTGRVEDEQFYTHRLVDHRTAVLMLLDEAPAHYTVVDAWGPVADGPLGVMGCDRPNHQQRLYGGTDLMAVEATVISDLGLHPSNSEILRRADQWFGTRHQDAFSASEAGPMNGFRAPHSTWWFRVINATAVPVYANLSGNGRLFVPKMDERAFPPSDDPGLFVRSVRAIAQRLFGLRPTTDSQALTGRS